MDDIDIESDGDENAEIGGYVSDDGIVLRIRENNEILRVTLRTSSARRLAEWLLKVS